MRKKMFCPRCGEVDGYIIINHVKRRLLFDTNDKPQGTLEDEVFYSGKNKRCPKCNSTLRN